jgi:hypothetical protein
LILFISSQFPSTTLAHSIQRTEESSAAALCPLIAIGGQWRALEGDFGRILAEIQVFGIFL